MSALLLRVCRSVRGGLIEQMRIESERDVDVTPLHGSARDDRSEPYAYTFQARMTDPMRGIRVYTVTVAETVERGR